MVKTKASTEKSISERERRSRRLAYETAAEGIVLLENKGVLPVKPGKIALFGAGARYTIKGGTGSGEVYVRRAVTAEKGLEKAGFTITTKSWIRRYDAIWQAGKEAFIRENRVKLERFSLTVLAELLAAEYRYPAGDRIREDEIEASGTDTCLYIVSRQSGEGHDLADEPGSFRLDPVEEANIRLCAEKYEKFILIINAGAPIDLSLLDETEGIGAVVYMGQPGMEGGRALADVLTGRRPPSGKLAVTWPKRYADIPFGSEFGKIGENHAAYKEGIYVGYRYYDSFRVEPRYPFGYGLGYTLFRSEVRSAVLKGTEVSCEVSVSNTGSAPGREVLQMYVSCPQTGMEKEAQRLTSFAKTSLLQPGEEEVLTLKFPVSLLSVYDEAHAQTILETGDYLIRVGSSSRETKEAAVLRVEETVILSRHRNLCRPVRTIATLHPENRDSRKKPENGALPVLRLTGEGIQTESYTYAKKKESFGKDTKKFLRRFTAGDMVKFCSGTGLLGPKKGFSVPGSVGHTTTDYLDQGIPNIEMCDGPAGLRLQRRSTRTKKGRIKPLDIPMSLYEFLPDSISRLLLGNPRKEEVLYQFVTAFPTAAMIAQSWNTELALRIGRAVSAEMTEYGVRVWLAPALNLVRNPLCGRNYEYYSEDPVLSGKLAAAVTAGVQETPGNYVTIKHFAVNNQEENRYYVSSDLDERVLREIYLKGFEIAVKEGHPEFVMTAYNKVNDVYCANNRELCTDILRGEWGFGGAVMTDWFSTGDDRADEAKAVSAGVDLIMPGGRKTVRRLKHAVKKGTLSEKTLKRSCGRVLECVLENAVSRS